MRRLALRRDSGMGPLDLFKSLKLMAYHHPTCGILILTPDTFISWKCEQTKLKISLDTEYKSPIIPIRANMTQPESHRLSDKNRGLSRLFNGTSVRRRPDKEYRGFGRTIACYRSPCDMTYLLARNSARLRLQIMDCGHSV